MLQCVCFVQWNCFSFEYFIHNEPIALVAGQGRLNKDGPHALKWKQTSPFLVNQGKMWPVTQHCCDGDFTCSETAPYLSVNCLNSGSLRLKFGGRYQFSYRKPPFFEIAPSFACEMIAWSWKISFSKGKSWERRGGTLQLEYDTLKAAVSFECHHYGAAFHWDCGLAQSKVYLLASGRKKEPWCHSKK